MKIKLGDVGHVPEIMVKWEGGSPCGYRSESAMKIYLEVKGIEDGAELEEAVRECVMKAASGMVLSAISGQVAISIETFKAALLVCLGNKAKGAKLALSWEQKPTMDWVRDWGCESGECKEKVISRT